MEQEKVKQASFPETISRHVAGRLVSRLPAGSPLIAPHTAIDLRISKK